MKQQTWRSRVLFRSEAQLGEGPVWSDHEQCLYWVDILSRTVHRFYPETRAYRQWEFPEQVTSLALRQQGGLVCTVRDGFAFLDLDNGSVTPIALVEADVGRNRFNDGKADALGNFWAGSMDDEQKEKSASLYRLSPDLKVETVDSGYTITNGPAFCADGGTFFHNETKDGFVYRMRSDGAAALTAKEVFARYNNRENPGLPDGMTVDDDDCLWVAHFGGGGITRFSPEGERIGFVEVPAPNITSCTFGGPNNETLFITSARVGMSHAELERQPLAGSIFVCKPGVQGRETARFAG